MSRTNIVIGLLTILVVATCIAVVVTIRAEREQQQRIAACDGSYQCYESLILSEIHVRGLDAGFRLLARVYDEQPTFRSDCGTFTMTLSKALYAAHPDYRSFTFTPAIETCNYAFLQQYPTELIIATKNVAMAQDLCARVAGAIGAEVPGAESECYRGIGKGLPFILEARGNDQAAMAAFALAKCREIAPNADDYGTCVSGLFNNIGRSAIANASGLHIIVSDPMYLCEVQTDPEARSRCFGNYKATVISMVNISDPIEARAGILRLFGNAASSSADDAIWTIGYEWARTRLVADDSVASTIAACASLPVPAMKLCIQGVSVGIAKNGTPGRQYVLLTEFCHAARLYLPSLAIADCPSRQALGYLRGFYSPYAFEVAMRFTRDVLGDTVATPDGFGY